MPFRILLIACLAALASCVTDASREACGTGDTCRLSGTLSPVTAGDIDMGRMDLANGECIAVSLPDHRMRDLIERGPYATTISGRVFDDPGGPELNVAQIIVNDRPVAPGVCGGDFFVFVY